VSSSDIPVLPPSRAEKKAARKTAPPTLPAERPKRRFSAKSAITGVLAVQLAIALFLMGSDLFRAIPHIAWPSTQPRFDTPVIPGDQTRRFNPRDCPAASHSRAPATR